MKNTLDKLKEKNFISEDQKSLLEEYNARLKNNKVAIIYNLRHLRKILKIRKKINLYSLVKIKKKVIKFFISLKKMVAIEKLKLPTRQC